MNKVYGLVAAHPWSTIALFGLVTALLAAPIPTLTIETDVMSMMPQDHPVNLYGEWVEEYFGIDESAVLLVIDDGPQGVFTPHTLALVQHLTTAVAAEPAIDGEDVVSLAAIDNISAVEDMLAVAPFFENPPGTQAEAAAIRGAVFGNPMVVDGLVSADGRATVIVAETVEGYEKEDVYGSLEKIVSTAPITTETVLIAGRPVIDAELGIRARRDLRFMFPLVVVAAGLLLLLTLRCLRGVLLPLFVVVASATWPLGLMAWSHSRFFPITTIMPTLLVAIGVAHGIHIIHDFLLRVAARPTAVASEHVVATMREVGPPIIMASLTTAAGLGALSLSSLQPIQSFGFFAAFGVIAGMGASLTLLPAVLCVMPVPLKAAARATRSQEEGGGVVAYALAALTPLVTRHPYLVAGLGVLVCIAGLGGMPRIVVDGSVTGNFADNNPVARADEALVARFGGSTPMEIVLDGGYADAWKEPRKLQALEEFQRHLEDSGRVGKTKSIADYIKRMHAVMNADVPAAGAIPDDQDLIAQYLLLYSMAGEPDDFDDVVDYDYRFANLRSQIGSDHSPVLRAVMEDVHSYASVHLAPLGIDVQISGGGRSIATLVDLIVDGQIRSLAVGLLLVTALTGVMGRSAGAGIVTMIPVAIATALNFGLLGWLRLPLTPPTAVMSALGIGVGVDYAIHFVVKYRRVRRDGMEAEAAMHETLRTTGVAIFYNAIVVVGGFLVLATSEFPPNRVLGLLVSLNIMVCFLGTVTGLAAVLHAFQPTFVRPRPSRQPVFEGGSPRRSSSATRTSSA